ncbi:Molybdopterin molybdenumtransferase [Planctomycetes bacterium Poly30]|uniref:Molybdopterin molybdenumtransferase n=1 Tax=Saltatorellus ferox TaxID=2528018 RepID=A0A518ESW4_9BACT|nr:Molybdopterin molybdenumtransferase [Planctomycetes bacterium Poly30]
MLTFEEAVRALAALDVGARATRVERIPLARARGRVLAEDIAIDQDQPGFDRATMDGFAVCLDGQQRSFRIRGVVTAGTTFEGTLAPGEAVRIMTGAPAPAETTVVPIERTTFEEGQATVEVDHVPDAGRNVAWRGEDAHAGDVLVARGTRLAPAHLSVAAMAGAVDAAVFQRPVVSVVTTGDEVGGTGAAAIRDSNGPLLDGLLDALGADVQRRHARDDEGELAGALEDAAASADIIVTTGGVSMGTHDLVPSMLDRLGFETVFHKVQVQPGKPVLVAARGDGALFIGLPGNPVSVLATAHLFLFPALGHFLGGWAPRWIEVPMASDYSHDGRRHLFLPASIETGGLRPASWNGSGDLIAAAAADGLVELPVGATFRAGDPARFLPYIGHSIGERAVLPPRQR